LDQEHILPIHFLRQRVQLDSTRCEDSLKCFLLVLGLMYLRNDKSRIGQVNVVCVLYLPEYTPRVATGVTCDTVSHVARNVRDKKTHISGNCHVAHALLAIARKIECSGLTTLGLAREVSILPRPPARP
jgi:hypothetical protein